jgi:predicted NodU family carbamoyl transferase
MRILAFNISHDSSVCIINDGEIEFFCKEERLSRVKRDKHPFKSLEKYVDKFVEFNDEHPKLIPNLVKFGLIIKGLIKIDLISYAV